MTSPSVGVPTSMRARAIAEGLAAAVIAAALGVAIAMPSATLGITALAAVACAAAVWWSRPRAALALTLAVLVFVPVYATPSAGPFNLPAGVWLGAIGIGVVAVRQHRVRLHVTGIDLAVLALFSALVASYLAGARSAGDAAGATVATGAAYGLGRSVIGGPISSAMLLRALVGVALATVPLAIAESLTEENPFFDLARSGPVADLWATPIFLENGVRVETSFGHPIAYAMFLAAAALAATMLAALSNSRAEMIGWLSATPFLLVAMSMTQSRTGWAIIVIGGALILVKFLGAVSRMRVLVAAAAFTLAVGTVSILSSSTTHSIVALVAPSERQAASAEFRRRLLREGTKADAFSAFGNPSSELGVEAGAASGSIDNEYLYVADRWGLVAVVPMLFIWAGLGVAAFRLSGADAALGVAAFALSTGLVFVALITQIEPLYWLLVGAMSGAIAATRRS